jgi:SP family sugar:H+ symporter-like MFS transporter
MNVAEARHHINVGFVVLIAAAAALGGFLFGFDSAVINGAVPGIQASFAATSAGTGFAVTFPPLLNQLGPSVAYAIYALFAAVSIAFVVRSIAETKGRELEQM